MKPLWICLMIFVINSSNEANSDDSIPPEIEEKILKKEEKKISEYVIKILDHYKQEDPVGLPGVPIPDPLPIPDLSHSMSGATMKMKKIQLYGLKNFRINEVKANIAAMKVETSLNIDKLQTKGNYTLTTFFSSAEGPFTVNLTNVFATATATLEVKRNGRLEAQDMDMDVSFEDIQMEFQGLGFMASVFQSVINSLGNFVFESIKPFVLKEVNTNMRENVNEQIEKLNQTFPNSITPFDQLISEVRHKIRAAGYDPYQVKDYNNSVAIFDIYLTHTWLFGLSSIHRYGDILFEIRNKTVYIIVDVGTQRLKGVTNWEVSLVSGIVSRSGTVAFTVEYVRVEISVSQLMDTRNHPNLEDIQLELGNIQIRFDGTGTLDYVVELAINVLPNILRYQIMDAIEKPFKMRVQEILNKVNIESLIHENVKKFDEDPDSFQFLQ